MLGSTKNASVFPILARFSAGSRPNGLLRPAFERPDAKATTSTPRKLTDSSQGVIKPGQFSVETLGQISVEIDILLISTEI